LLCTSQELGVAGAPAPQIHHSRSECARARVLVVAVLWCYFLLSFFINPIGASDQAGFSRLAGAADFDDSRHPGWRESETETYRVLVPGHQKTDKRAQD
jgi:hypothetical protein